MEQAVGILIVLFCFFLCSALILACYKICRTPEETESTNPIVIQSSILLSNEAQISHSSTTPFLRNNLQANQRISSQYRSGPSATIGFMYSSEASCSNQNGMISSRRNVNTTSTIGSTSNLRMFSQHNARNNQTSNQDEYQHSEQPPPSYAEATAT